MTKSLVLLFAAWGLVAVAGCSRTSRSELPAGSEVGADLPPTPRTYPLTTDELRRLRVLRWELMGYNRDRTNRESRSATLTVENGTDDEIAALDVRMRFVRDSDGGVEYETGPGEFDYFMGERIPHLGSLLPHNIETVRYHGPSFDSPAGVFKAGEHIEFRIAGATRFAPDEQLGLDFAGHVFTHVIDDPPAALVDYFRQNPDAIHVKTLDKMTPTAVALASRPLPVCKGVDASRRAHRRRGPGP